MRNLQDKDLLVSLIKDHGLMTILPEDVLASCEICVFERNEPILIANQILEYFYFFVKGKLKIFQIYENGKAYLIQFYRNFDSLGEVELNTDALTSCSVQAIETSLLIRIPMDILKKYAYEYPPFLRYMASSLASKLMVADRHHASNLLYPVKNRLASYLRAHMNEKCEILLEDSLLDLSDFLGTTYRQLHRALKQLEEEKVVIRYKKHFKVMNMEELNALGGKIYEGPY